MIQREPPAGVVERWQPELDRIAQPTERGHSHLMLLWEPGENWAPVERWVIWEMIRPQLAPLNGSIWFDLMGPPPRSFGRWDNVLERFKRTRTSLVNQRQWEVYQETGLYGRPVWIVQGEKGGHKRQWNSVEQNVAILAYNLPADSEVHPAVPGELCYAEPDERTVRLLAGLDMVRRYGDVLKVFQHSDALRERLDIRERDQLQEMARQVWMWMGDQVEEHMTLTRDQVTEIWDHADPDGEVPDYDRGYEDFVETIADTTPM